MKVPNLLIAWTAVKNLALPYTLSRKTPPELFSQKTTVEIPQNRKLFLAKDKTSPRLQCKYALKSDVEQSQINNLHYFTLYLDCQNKHYIQTDTILYLDKKQYTTKTTQTEAIQKRFLPLIEKENLTDKVIYQAHQTLIQNIQLAMFLTSMTH